MSLWIFAAEYSTSPCCIYFQPFSFIHNKSFTYSPLLLYDKRQNYYLNTNVLMKVSLVHHTCLFNPYLGTTYNSNQLNQYLFFLYDQRKLLVQIEQFSMKVNLLYNKILFIKYLVNGILLH